MRRHACSIILILIVEVTIFFQMPDASIQSKNIDRRDKILRQAIMKM